MSEFEVLDPRFRKLIIDPRSSSAGTGAHSVEGPAYFPAGRYLVFSDIPNDRIMRYETRRAARFRYSASLQAMPTGTPSISKAVWSVASAGADGSPAPSMTEASSPWRRS